MVDELGQSFAEWRKELREDVKAIGTNVAGIERRLGDIDFANLATRVAILERQLEERDEERDRRRDHGRWLAGLTVALCGSIILPPLLTALSSLHGHG